MKKTLHDVDPATLKQWIAQDRCCLIDVREPYEYTLARITGATLLPTSTFTPDQLPKDEERPFVFYCKAGVRSARAAEKFMETGPDEAYHLEGGIDFWMESGMPVEQKKNMVISLERQFQLALGSILTLLLLLTMLVSPAFIWGIAFIAAGLLFAGSTGICGLSIFLAKLPFNQR